MPNDQFLYYVFVFALGPNVYNVHVADKVLHEASPGYSFGAKVNLDKPSDTPG